ncbi:MAG TPA: hypothetical protein VGS97_16665 [Actinocrinis sp.]|uniref:hypothetical protein n=1 Tax=Actinocrinis sp. TaxID=1920516 RepID=UPI002DDD8B13|nr:hypothetical protein [Actinocrinis sp.]HEV2345734.1 hypothetical protein [Actinocrinis sp.]
MHVTRAQLTRWAASAALLAGIGLTGAAGPGARADIGGGGGFWIATHIELTGSVYSGGGSPYYPSGWSPPKCWLELNTGYGVGAAYTPDGFAAYMAQVYAFYDNALQPDIKNAFEQLYYYGHGVDAGVGLTNPPYNEGLGGGKWYAIACTPDAGYGDYVAVQSAMGVANQYEEWFWLADGASAGAPVMDPNLLAEYAAANTLVAPGWPNFSPRLNAMQTVNLATLITNGAGANGFHSYAATATLPATGQSSTVYATPRSVTFSSSGPTSPSSVTCYFNGDGSLRSGCRFTFLKSTSASYTVYESSMWNVTWGGDPITGEPGWTRQIGPVRSQYNPVRVQEIQTVVGQ